MPLGRQFDDSNLLTSSIKLIAEIKIQMNKSTSLTSMFPGYGPIEIYQGIRHGKLTPAPTCFFCEHYTNLQV